MRDKAVIVRKASLLAAAALTVGLGGLGVATLLAPKAAIGADAPTVTELRRVTETQYRHTIADVFGADIQVKGRFEPELRQHGLLSIGATAATISSLGFQQYFAMARSISTQVTDAKHRDKLVPCKPADAKAADDACATAFIQKYGRVLFRRPMADADVKARVALARQGATADGDFYSGLRLALNSMLTAPEFLFRQEVAVRGPGGAQQLDAYTRASRLSYLFWDTTPDEELLKAAESGAIMTPEGLKKQVDRLATSPRLEFGTRALFADTLQFDKFLDLTKNPDIYPKYSLAVGESALEQTMRTVVNHLVVKDRDFRDLLTTRETFLNRSIASVYRVPYTWAGEWMPYTFPEAADRPGLTSQVTFLAMFSHPGRSSPTIRGKGLKEVFLCEETPPPPDDIDFSVINNVTSVELKTVRERLLAHATDETCAGCHVSMDPIGLSLERFDSLGQPRTMENGAVIDVSSEIDGRKFSGGAGLSQVLHDNPRVPACFVQQAFSYGAGREPMASDAGYLKTMTDEFAKGGYKYRALLVRIATSPQFYGIAPAKLPAAPKAVAQTSQPAAQVQNLAQR